MPVTTFEIRTREAFEGGTLFGDGGAYERIDGVVHVAVDPLHAANAGVVDIDRAARDAGGLVRFDADVTLLQPVDPARANGRLLADVVNRGGRTFMAYNLAARDAQRPQWIPPGDGFLMNRGWTIASIGWQWDVLRANGLMGMTAPAALADGRPIDGWVCVTHQLTAAAPHVPLADGGHQPYVAADLDQHDARLLVRDYPDAPRREIARARWRFARLEGGTAVPDAGHVVLDGGFERGLIYEIIYRTSISPVVGAGLLAFRDAASFFRYSTAADNPARGRITHAFALGISQSGRFVRNVLLAGANADEAGRRVFDGVHIHIGGGRQGEYNHRYAQPSVIHPYGLAHRPPFAFDDTVDLRTGAALPGLLARVRALGVAPKVIATNTATEYWRGDASMLHIDPSGTRDLPDPPEARAYLFAGAQHGVGGPPLADTSPVEPSARGANRFNITHYGPLFRAALVNLERWVCEGVEPPPSAVPRVADGTAVTRAAVIEAFHALPAAVTPDPARLWSLPRLDLGPNSEGQLTTLPPVAGEPFPTLVSAVDADGNEVAGIRAPDVSVPLATLTGWNPRHPESGGAGQIMPLTGSTIPFPISAAERVAVGDPRRSIEERYEHREDYLGRVRTEAERLVAQRYLLAGDVDVVVANADRRWDALVPARV